MAREDYLAIKGAYEQFARAWERRDGKALDEVFIPETACNLSIVAKYPCGSQHSIFGVRDFVEKTPESDFFHIIPCNFVARIAGNRAQQSAVLVARAGVYEGDKVRVCEFTALNSNSWELVDGTWKIVEFKLEIDYCMGDFEEFTANWYFEKPGLTYYHGIHLPVISGELDAPWRRIPVEDEGNKTDEELILETFSRYAFGIDSLNFSLLVDALSDDVVVNMAPWGAMDKREFMQTLKFKRQASNNWSHPAQLESVKVDGDAAELRLNRMAGHRQSAIPLVFTPENAETVYADARYEIKMVKEDGLWMILRMDYFLGAIDLGSFSAETAE